MQWTSGNFEFNTEDVYTPKAAVNAPTQELILAAAQRTDEASSARHFEFFKMREQSAPFRISERANRYGDGNRPKPRTQSIGNLQNQTEHES